MFVHQVEGISRELGTPSAFALHQEGVVRAWHEFISSRLFQNDAINKHTTYLPDEILRHV